MAYSSIVKPSVYFNTKLYTGNGTNATGITGVGFQPDWVWIKERSSTSPHKLLDAVRGATKELESNSTSAEATESTSLQSFDSDGFTVGTNGAVNENSQTYASWNWKANGSGSANTDGSINTTATSVNTTAGFSISTYTGTGSAGATIGHGLGAVPKMIITKKLNGAPNWGVYHAGLGSASKYLELNLNSAEQTDNAVWDGANPTASLFYVGGDNKTNGSGGNYVAYCFAEKTGYSKFGSYTGNGNSDGTFVYTGFKPAFVMVKKYSSTSGWYMNDNKRDAFNVSDSSLFANTNDAEFTSSSLNVDMLSNGFKLRSNNSEVNGNTYTYIYMCFAEEPLVANSGTDGVPATAR